MESWPLDCQESLLFYFLSGRCSQESQDWWIDFWPYYAACGILVSPSRVWTMAPVVEAWGPNHWTAREFPESQDLEIGLEEWDLQERIYLEGTSAECTQSGLCTVLISDFRGLSVGMAPAYTPVAPRGAGEGDHSSHIILVFFSTSLKEVHSDQNSEYAGQMRLRINPQVPLLPGQLTPQAVLLRASRAAIGVYRTSFHLFLQ